MTEPREPSFTAKEVEEAFASLIEPATVAALLQRYNEQKRAEEHEIARMRRMVDIIDEYDEVTLLENEGTLVKPDSLMSVAKSYVYHLRDQEFIDELDKKARLLSLYILATMDGPYTGGEELEEELEHQPIDGLEIKLLMKCYVIDKYGHEAWLPEYDGMEFIDLFSYENMNYFDGESFTEIMAKQPLVNEIREELDRQGFKLAHRKGESS